VLLVDDGSSDRSWSCIQEISREDGRFRGIRLSRNFGQQAALLAGLGYSQGEMVVTLDADLQDPPELIPAMIQRCQQGAALVYAVRSKRDHDPLAKRLFATLFYWSIRRVTGLDIPANTGEFRLAKRACVEEVLKLQESRPFLRGMFAWIGFSRAFVEYERPERYAGSPKFTFRKSLSLALDAFISFSNIGDRLLLLLGSFSLLSLVCFGLLFEGEIRSLLLLSSLLVSIGLQQLHQGIFRTENLSAAQRPPYVIEELIGEGISLSEPKNRSQEPQSSVAI
jgi:dolichol-phosphate mannosyltransferase